MPKIVVLDGFVVNPGDLDWSVLNELGQVEIYDRTPSDLILSRSKEVEIILNNKCVFDQSTLKQLPNLQYIGLIATGYNNIDIAAAKDHGIVVSNAVGYGSTAVAQHVFALLLELTNNVGIHSQSVHQNEWATAKDWCYWNKPLIELQGKTLGIYGLGSIGTQVARIGLAFGMTVMATRQNHNKPSVEGVTIVEEQRLFTDSDVLTLHAPLTPDNQNFIDSVTLKKMKPSSFLINTGRGGLVHEADLKKALETGEIAGAALDVLKEEPPQLDHILLHAPNCLITPHQAWAAKASRQRLLDIVIGNVRAFLEGNPKNCV